MFLFSFSFSILIIFSIREREREREREDILRHFTCLIQTAHLKGTRDRTKRRVFTDLYHGISGLHYNRSRHMQNMDRISCSVILASLATKLSEKMPEKHTFFGPR